MDRGKVFLPIVLVTRMGMAGTPPAYSSAIRGSDKPAQVRVSFLTNQTPRSLLKVWSREGKKSLGFSL